MTHEIGNDEEVPGEPHLSDNAEFVGRLFGVLFRYCIAEAVLQPSLHLRDEERSLVIARWQGEARHQITGLAKFHVAAFCDAQRVVARFRQLRPEVTHLRRRLEVEVARIELESRRIIKVLAGLHA